MKSLKITMIFLQCLTLLMMGCRGLKTNVKEKGELKGETVVEGVGVSAAVRERNVLKYWPDGSVYSLERMLERVDEAQVLRSKAERAASWTEKEMRKERVPVQTWMYAVLGLILISAGFFFRGVFIAKK